jgi:hypothetical protein
LKGVILLGKKNIYQNKNEDTDKVFFSEKEKERVTDLLGGMVKGVCL